MPDHDFEKNVQEKMGEFRLAPSQPVWDKVAEQLNKKDKRRRGFLWIPAMVAAAVSLYFIINLNNTGKSATQQHKVALHPPTKTNAGQEKRISEPISETDPQQNNDALKDQVTGSEKSEHTSSAPLPGLNADNGNQSRQVKQPTVTTNVSTAEKDRSRSADNFPANRRTAAPDRFSSENNIDSKMPADKDAGTPDRVANREVAELERTLLPMPVKGQLQTNRNIDVPGTIKIGGFDQKNIQPAVKRKKPLEYGIAFSIGRSQVTNGGIADMFNHTPVFAYASDRNNAQANNPVNGGGFAGVPSPPPSNLKPGLALSAGAYVKKQVSPALRLSVGLNYKLYTTSHMRGAVKDTLVTPSASNGVLESLNSVYKTGNDHRYTNQFHFIELPVNLEGRLINGKLPLNWNLGASVSRLIASNALHYDMFNRFYYKQNKLLQKNQVNLRGAITTRLFSRSANPVMIGPEFSYGITDLLKYKEPRAKHFIFVGLSTSMALNKK